MPRSLPTRLLALRLWMTERLRPGEGVSTFLWAALIGALAGLSSPAFRAATTLVQWAFTGHTAPLVETAALLPAWQRVIVPTAGGLLAGLVLHFGVHFARGRKGADFMEAITLGDGVIRTRPSLVRIVSSLFTIGSGGSIGREGPMVQLAALVSSAIGRVARLPRPRLRLFVACGSAAGIASAYNAPIGGALFVAEIVLGSIAVETFGPLLVSSAFAVAVARLFQGGEPLFVVPRFHLVSAIEFVPYVVLGLVAGAFGILFLGLLRRASAVFTAWNAPVFLRLTAGGLVVGLLSLGVPDVWGNGYNAVATILSMNVLWTALLTLLAFKLLATAATVGSGAVGGVFTPTLLVGAVVGGLIGIPVHQALPEHSASPSAYALVGMAALLAATTHAPFMAIVILFEMTLDYDIVLPLMLACVAAYGAARALGGASIYAGSLRAPAPAAPLPLDTLRVRDLMRADPQRVTDAARFPEVVQAFVRSPHHNLYVVDGRGVFRGAIPLHEIKPYLADPDLAKLAIAQDLLREDFPTVTPETTLRETLERFSKHPFERIPVVEPGDGRRLVASISKTDLLLTLSAKPGAGGALPRA